MNLILASQSASRRAMLDAAGVKYKAVKPLVDEDQVKASLAPQALSASDLAQALAVSKADSISDLPMSGMILGCDQTLLCDDGTMLDKAVSLDMLADQLARLSGRTHRLFSAAVIVENHLPVWHAVESARMTMRPLSKSFIADYLAREGEALLGCVGGYRIEGRGVQLFDQVEGSQFVVQGLPLLPLLAYLRQRGWISS
jgi:septum formation protein